MRVNIHFSPEDSYWSLSFITACSTNQQLLFPSQPFPLNLCRRSPDWAFLRNRIHQNVSGLLTASLSDTALLLLLCEYELVRVQLGLAAAAWSLAEDVRTQGGLEVFFGCLLLWPQASVSTNERCVFKKLTSQLIKVGADGGVKVNCACNGASASQMLPNTPTSPPPVSAADTDTGLFWSSTMETRLPAQDCQADKDHCWPSDFKKHLSQSERKVSFLSASRKGTGLRRFSNFKSAVGPGLYLSQPVDGLSCSLMIMV